VQGGLLVSRTLLTDHISRLEGACGRAIVALRFPQFAASVARFAALGVPAALVNAGLKYMQRAMELAFQQRLGLRLHALYTANRAYYAASTLGGLTGADQRITEDVDKFVRAAAELYSYTLKPLLDVALFTRSLSRVMGYRGQALLYLYYVACARVLRATSPPLASFAAAEAGLAGAYRAAHQRLVSNAEEVAFNDPPAGGAERLVLNGHLRRLVRYCGLASAQRFLQQCVDGYLVKYGASAVALLVYAAPVYLAASSSGGGGLDGGAASQEQRTADYIRSMRLLQNTSRGVGDLILAYKRVSALAAHTGRVSELLETVGRLSGGDAEHRDLFRARGGTGASAASLSAGGEAVAAGATEARLALQQQQQQQQQEGGGVGGGGEAASALLLPPPRRVVGGDAIVFDRVALDAPDGTPLVRELSFRVDRGRSVMLMGPNGCGKSSLFRVLAGLWPLLAGEVRAPPKGGGVFYLSQRPYLVSGTLRDQLLYPLPPAAVWAASTPDERAGYAAMAARSTALGGAGGGGGGIGVGVGDAAAIEDAAASASGAALAPAPPLAPASDARARFGGSLAALDAELARCLAAVELDYLLARAAPLGWDAQQDWRETLSGGEKQRLAMARLLFHRPAFAVLDECTSAVSADGEARLYEACLQRGVTLLSIAHRPSLKRYHAAVVHVGADGPPDGGGAGAGGGHGAAGGAGNWPPSRARGPARGWFLEEVAAPAAVAVAAEAGLAAARAAELDLERAEEEQQRQQQQQQQHRQLVVAPARAAEAAAAGGGGAGAGADEGDRFAAGAAAAAKAASARQAAAREAAAASGATLFTASPPQRAASPVARPLLAGGGGAEGGGGGTSGGNGGGAAAVRRVGGGGDKTARPIPVVPEPDGVATLLEPPPQRSPSGASFASSTANGGGGGGKGGGGGGGGGTGSAAVAANGGNGSGGGGSNGGGSNNNDGDTPVLAASRVVGAGPPPSPASQRRRKGAGPRT